MAAEGTGTTLTFGTSSLSLELTSIQLNGRQRVSLETTHLGTTGHKTFTPGELIDAGGSTIEFYFDGTQDIGTQIAADPETLTFTWPNGDTSFAVSGFAIEDGKSGISVDTLMTGTMELKFTGAPTEDITTGS